MNKDDNKNLPSKKLKAENMGALIGRQEQNCGKQLSTIAAKYRPLVLVTSNRNCSICGKFGKIANFAFISATNTAPQTQKGMMT